MIATKHRTTTESHVAASAARATQRRPANAGGLPDAAASRAPRVVAQRRQLAAAFGSAIQRVAIEDEEPLQARVAPAQRVGMDEEEPLQGKFAVAQRAAAETADAAAATVAPNRTGMPDRLKAGIESLSGLAMDDVRVHYNSAQPAQLNALAYAQGTDIHVAPGQERHLPHEAWHVVQQAQGRVQPTMQLRDRVPVNDDAGLEQEADVMGARASAGPGRG